VCVCVCDFRISHSHAHAQAREISRLEEQVRRLTDDAVQASALRMELAATRAALDELRTRTLVGAADGELRAEVCVTVCV
jgi:hypothetical protein